MWCPADGRGGGVGCGLCRRPAGGSDPAPLRAVGWLARWQALHRLAALVGLRLEHRGSTPGRLGVDRQASKQTSTRYWPELVERPLHLCVISMGGLREATGRITCFCVGFGVLVFLGCGTACGPLDTPFLLTIFGGAGCYRPFYDATTCWGLSRIAIDVWLGGLQVHLPGCLAVRFPRRVALYFVASSREHSFVGRLIQRGAGARHSALDLGWGWAFRALRQAGSRKQIHATTFWAKGRWTTRHTLRKTQCLKAKKGIRLAAKGSHAYRMCCTRTCMYAQLGAGGATGGHPHKACHA